MKPGRFYSNGPFRRMLKFEYPINAGALRLIRGRGRDSLGDHRRLRLRAARQGLTRGSARLTWPDQSGVARRITTVSSSSGSRTMRR